ncbi:hypothetical protein SAY87_026294 [Trapa incisa]|uniref:Uncharacterized protein n=1 Tax=Trapa incisa TaxID=236973 RepID=A0AAN7GV60_9MYRT|nr:hypothetical protein SAY87_026294 [Trapa incisa]
MLWGRAGATMFVSGVRSFLGHSGCLIPWIQSTANREFSTNTAGKLHGKVALITGAASGLGKVAAATFIANGAKVVIADIDSRLGQETADQLGPHARFTPCNVVKELDVSNAVDFTVSELGHLDIMFNNAGIPCKTPSSIADLDLARFDQVMATNVRGMVAGIKHASRVMIPNKTGSILCTASVTGVLGGMSQHTYSISKCAVIGLVRSVSSELCRHGIRINSISPFVVPTRLVMNEMKEIYAGAETGRIIDIINHAGVLEGTSCEAVDIANAALYLASDDAKYVSGQNLVIDGGFTAFKSLNFPQP